MDGAVRSRGPRPRRRRLLDRLHAENGQTLDAPLAQLDMPRQAVSKHLAVLERANLVVTLTVDVRSCTP